MANSAKSESSSKEPDEDEDEDEENAPNKANESYEVAWQCLETARIILRQNDPNSLRFERCSRCLFRVNPCSSSVIVLQ